MGVPGNPSFGAVGDDEYGLCLLVLSERIKSVGEFGSSLVKGFS